MRSPSVFDVRRIEIGSNQAHSIRMLRVLKLNFAFRAAHHAADAERVRRIADHGHVFCERPLHAIQRAQLLAGTSAAHDDAMFVQFVEIECVQCVAQLEHHVIGDVHHVVDGISGR